MITSKKLQESLMETIEVGTKKLLEFPWESKEHYTHWMTQQFYLVQHTTRILCMAAGKLAPSDKKTYEEFAHHIREEKNHDLLLVNDLKFLGRTPEDYPPHLETRLIVQNQYYWIQNHHPCSLLGYAVLLEGLACYAGPKIVAKLKDSYEKKAYTFLATHAIVDQDHFPDNMKAVEEAPAEAREGIYYNLQQSNLLYFTMLNDVMAAKAPKKNVA